MILQAISIYILIGAIWSCWLEHFTMKELPAPYNQPWTNKERLYHIILVVVSFSVFAYVFIRDYFEKRQ